MRISGIVKNGVVVLDGDVSLPEGERVVVFHPSPRGQQATASRNRVELPLVRNGKPGSIQLTNERIQQILDEEDVASLKRT